MLNDFPAMLFAIVASQGGIALILVVMAKLEPQRPATVPPRKAAPAAVPVHRTGRTPEAPASAPIREVVKTHLDLAC